MSTFTIPLSGYAETFSIALNNVTYQLTIQWRGSWFMDIADSSNTPIVSGISIVSVVDLLGSYGYLDIGGSMYMVNTAGGDAPPTFTNIGTDCILQYVTA